jgi:hypothetical protein
MDLVGINLITNNNVIKIYLVLVYEVGQDCRPPGGGRRGRLFFGNLYDVRGLLQKLNPLRYEKSIEKKNCIRTNGKLENGLVYLY